MGEKSAQERERQAAYQNARYREESVVHILYFNGVTNEPDQGRPPRGIIPRFPVSLVAPQASG
jgi:hypothetical protein